MTKGPVLIDLDAQESTADPAMAAPIQDADAPQIAALQKAAQLAAGKPSRLGRWFWSLAFFLASFVVSLATWDYITALLARAPLLGWIATGLTGLLCFTLAIIVLRECVAFARLRRLDRLQNAAQTALKNHDLNGARTVTRQLTRLYAGREETKWGSAALAEKMPELLDAEALFAAAETKLLAPLDAAATREVESAARQVATVTALVPIALADLFTALAANMRMIRRIAEIYGGRSGTFGSWRLTRAVLAHLVATGAVAVGDDLIGSVAGGGVLAKVSRRFGEGIINGALTARVGVAAIEVCRPLPFHMAKRPSVTQLVRRALTGVFAG